MDAGIRFPTTSEFDFVWRAARPDEAAKAADEMELPFALPGAASTTTALGRIADWTAAGAAVADKRVAGAPGGFRSSRVVTTHASIARAEDAEAAGWSSVAAEPKPAPGAAPRAPERRGPPTGALPPRRPGPRTGGWGPRFASGPAAAMRKREASVAVHGDWTLVEDIEFSRLAKLQVDAGDAREIQADATRSQNGSSQIGSALVLDAAADRGLSARAGRPLPLLDACVLGASAQSSFVPLAVPDERMLQCAPEDEEEEEALDVDAVVDADAAALLMACQRTVVPWDLVARRDRATGVLLLERRPDAGADALHVNETAPGDAAPADDVPGAKAGAPSPNTAGRLSAEALAVRDQVVAFLGRGDSTRSPESSPSPVERWTHVPLGSGRAVLVRTRVSLVDADGHPVVVVPLLEYETRPAGSALDWRTRLDAQRGAVLAHEIRNNSALLARAVFSALLCGARTIKLAFVSRTSPRDRCAHVLLGVQDYAPRELAAVLNLGVPGGFGVLRALLDLCAGATPAALVREPNRAMLRLYRMPAAVSAGLEDDDGLFSADAGSLARRIDDLALEE